MTAPDYFQILSLVYFTIISTTVLCTVFLFFFKFFTQSVRKNRIPVIKYEFNAHTVVRYTHK
jgi:hypothetical protein